MPYLEQQTLSKRYDYQRAWHDGAPRVGPSNTPDLPQARSGTNAAVAATFLAIFQCPTGQNWSGTTDYGGNYGTILTGLPAGFGEQQGWSAGTLVAVRLNSPSDARRKPVTLAEIHDGTSHTFLVMEDTDRPATQAGQWANGHNCIAHDHGPINSHQSAEMFSLHPGGAHALLTDGSVHFYTQATPLPVLGALCTRSGKEMNTPQH